MWTLNTEEKDPGQKLRRGRQRLNTVGSREAESKGIRMTLVNSYTGERWKKFKKPGGMQSSINGNRMVSLTEMVLGVTCRRMKIECHLMPYTKIN